MIDIPNENPDLEKVAITLENPLEVKREFTNKDIFQTVGGISTSFEASL